MVICSQVTFTFANNTVADQNGQGQAIYANDISVCLTNNTAHTTDELFNISIFSNEYVFDFRQVVS